MLRLIKGGLLLRNEKEKKFVSAKVMNTRLMGAIYVYACWEAENEELFHQFFHIDTEEYGIESYESIWSDDEDLIYTIEMEVSGCLGGQYVPIEIEELRYILVEATGKNLESENKLPENIGELSCAFQECLSADLEKMGANLFEEIAAGGLAYSALDTLASCVNSIDVQKLLEKQCEKIETENQLINYFLMRCLGRDFEIASTLYAGEIDEEIFENIPITCMHRNKIIKVNGIDNTYRCETLGEVNGIYTIFNFMICVESLKVINIELVDRMQITPFEVSLILTVEEYLVTYRLSEVSDVVNKYMGVQLRRTVKRYENGIMLLFYSDNNKHIHNQIFNIRDDVVGGVFVSEEDELVLWAPNEELIEAIRNVLETVVRNDDILEVKKYHLNRSVILDFADAEGFLFEEYMEMMTGEGEFDD